MSGRYLEFHADGSVSVENRFDPLEMLYSRASDMDYSAIHILCDIKQQHIDEGRYEELIRFRDLEDKYEVAIPFIVRED